jgi:hypothetical protein
VRKLLLISCVMALSSPAFAQTIDAKGANQLADTLSKYFGKTALKKGILKVTPEADTYRVTLSFDALMKSLPKQSGVTVKFSDYSFLTKPLADGTWDVSSGGFPGGSFEFNGPKGPETFEFNLTNGKWSGLFDPKIGALTKASSSYDAFKMTVVTPEQDMDASAGASTTDIIATAATAGGINYTFNQTAKDFVETISTKLPKLDEPAGETNAAPAVAPVKVVVRSDEIGMSSEGSGYRSSEILNLWAFFMAHAEEKKLKKADEAELKQKLKASLPLWDKLKGAYQFKNSTVETPMGNFSAQNISQDVAFDGISKNGTYNYTLRSNGLKYPTLPIPEWGVPFLPTDVELTVGTTGLDLDTVVKGAIDDMDFNRDNFLSEEFGAKTAAQFLLAPPKLVISKSLVRTADAELTVEGEVTFTGLKPESHTTWEMAGFDKVVERLNKAAETDEEVKKSVIFVKLAKDFGTQIDGGKIQWVVDQKADGSVAVNGNPVKGPDPVVEPGTDDAIDSATPEGEDEDPDADAGTAQ